LRELAFAGPQCFPARHFLVRLRKFKRNLEPTGASKFLKNLYVFGASLLFRGRCNDTKCSAYDYLIDVVNKIAATLRDRMKQDLKASMLAKQAMRTSVLKSILSEITYAEKASVGATQVTDDAIQTVLQRIIKKRLDSIQQFQDAQRQDLVDKEQAEMAYIQAYLPRQFSTDELRREVESVVAELNAQGPKAMGAVMKALKQRIPAGAAPNQMIAQVVSASLNKV
jgi:hypothetical protein